MSEVWNYFEVESEQNKIAVCSLCKLKCSFKTTISNLKKHLKTKHLGIFPVDPRQGSLPPLGTGNPSMAVDTDDVSIIDIGSSTSTSMTCISVNIPTLDIPSTSSLRPPAPTQSKIFNFLPKKMVASQRKKIDAALMLLFSLDFQPFRVVEDRGFRAFVEALNPSYQLPSRKNISNLMLSADYEKCLTEVRENMNKENILSVCLTTDCWTSAAQESYIAVTAHYFDPDFVIKSVLLECAPLPGSHTSINLSQELRRLLLEWKLTSKVIMVVADNAKNIQNAIQELHLKKFGCMAHTINLTAQNGLQVEPIKTLLNKIKTCVSYFKRSTLATEKLLRYQMQVGEAHPKKLIQDVATRWNSVFFMVERFVVLEEAIRSTVGLIDKDLPVFTSEEWKMCKDLCTILKPLHEVTKELSGENYITGSLVIVFNRTLLNIYVEKIPQIPNIHPSVLEVAKVIANGIATRLDRIEFSGTFSVCTFLDPRFKVHLFQDTVAADFAKKKVIELAMAVILQNTERIEEESPVASSSTTNDDISSIWNDVDAIISVVQPVTSPQARAIAEVQRYLNDKLLPRKESPNDWWRKHQFVYPLLSEVYRKHCCVLATSVPCERMFSKSGQIISERRTSLSSRKVKQLMFLNVNKQ